MEVVEQTGGQLDYMVSSTGTGGTMTGTLKGEESERDEHNSSVFEREPSLFPRTGLSRCMKENIPDCKVIAVDPVGSILAVPDSLNTNIGEPNQVLTYAAWLFDRDVHRIHSTTTEVSFRQTRTQVEGIGYDFIPTVLDRDAGADHWVL